PPSASANDRHKAWRHFKRQLVGGLSSHTRLCSLRRKQSVRHELLRSAACRSPWNRCDRLRPLPWSSTHRISGGRKALGGTSGKRPGVCCCQGRTGRVGCALSAVVQSTTHHSESVSEVQHSLG